MGIHGCGFVSECGFVSVSDHVGNMCIFVLSFVYLLVSVSLCGCT